MGAYSIRRVDGDEYADDIAAIEKATELPCCPYDDVNWWLTFFVGAPVAYLGLMQSTLHSGAAYLVRVGVLKPHRGNRLQLRMMRVAERFAKTQGFTKIVSDTRFNTASANNFIRAGYETFDPAIRWSFADSIYWRKTIIGR
jgi:hypothetical protein